MGDTGGVVNEHGDVVDGNNIVVDGYRGDVGARVEHVEYDGVGVGIVLPRVPFGYDPERRDGGFSEEFHETDLGIFMEYRIAKFEGGYGRVCFEKGLDTGIQDGVEVLG